MPVNYGRFSQVRKVMRDLTNEEMKAVSGGAAEKKEPLAEVILGDVKTWLSDELAKLRPAMPKMD